MFAPIQSIHGAAQTTQIRRLTRLDPHLDCPPPDWTIPGGFVDIGETLEHATVREAREETSLEVTLTTLLGCYSDPQRDPRGHTVSPVYIATASGTPRAQDDAKHLALFTLDALPPILAFDHALILRDYLRYRTTHELPPPAR